LQTQDLLEVSVVTEFLEILPVNVLTDDAELTSGFLVVSKGLKAFDDCSLHLPFSAGENRHPTPQWVNNH